MRTQIPVPSKGDGLRASWGAAVASRVNELCAMAPAGMLSREGFGGIGAQPLPQNLRDRRSGGAGRPMPFDLKAEIETNEAGTQKRLVVKYYYITARVQFDAWPILSDYEFDSSLADNGWYTVYTGEWQSVDAPFDEEVSILLWYDIHLMIYGYASGGGRITKNPFAGGDQWWVEEEGSSETEPIAEWGPSINGGGNDGIAYHVCASTKLGEVRASGNQVNVRQWFHGTLNLYDFVGLYRYAEQGVAEDEGPTNGTTYPMPFQYKRTNTEDSEGNIISSYSITNCNFYWDGVYYSIDDFVPPATGSVYLEATKQGTGAGAWSFSLVTSPVANPTGDNQTFRLYDFEGSRIVMDYRTTTLTFGPGPRDYFEVVKSGGSAKVSLDATGTATHNVVIATADATKGEVRLRECDYYSGSSSTPEKVNILASKALTLYGAPDLAVVTGVTFKIENNKLKATLAKTNLRTGATSANTVDVCDVHELNVVTNTDYTNPDFTQSKQSVTVIGAAPSSSDAVTNVFTTTPLSREKRT